MSLVWSGLSAYNALAGAKSHYVNANIIDVKTQEAALYALSD